MRFVQKTHISCQMKIIAVSVFLFIATASFSPGHNAFSKEVAIYSIHLFALKTAEEAKIKVKEFKDRGYNAFFREEKPGDKEKVYNVYIERFKTRPEAEKEANILKDLDLIADFDVRDITGKSNAEVTEDKKDKKIEKSGNSISDNKATSIEKNGDDKAGSKSGKVEGSRAGTVPGQKVKVYYCLKVSSLKEKANAEEVVNTLQKAGYNAFYKFENVEGKGDWYRVYLDGYQSREAAEKEAKKLTASGIISGYEIKRKMDGIQTPELKEDTKKAFFLHVASFKDSAKADEEVRRLTGSGFRAVSNKADVSGEQWFRVYIGEFSTEKEAREKGPALIQQGVITYFKPMLLDKAVEPDKVQAVEPDKVQAVEPDKVQAVEPGHVRADEPDKVQVNEPDQAQTE
jgi:cell division septation protein DedD